MKSRFLMLQSSCFFFFHLILQLLIQSSKILDLSIFVTRLFLLQKSLCSSLSVLVVSLCQLSFQILNLSALFVCYCILIAFAESYLPYLKPTTFFRKQVSLFNYLCQREARPFTQTLHLGKGSGYVVNHCH